MKRLVLIAAFVALFASSAFAQTKTITFSATPGTPASAETPVPICPEGMKYFPSLGTSSLIIEGGCVTPDTYKKLQVMFAKNMCGETGFAFFGWDKHEKYGSGYDSGNHWNETTNECEYHPSCYIAGQTLREVDQVRCQKLIKWASERRKRNPNRRRKHSRTTISGIITAG